MLCTYYYNQITGAQNVDGTIDYTAIYLKPNKYNSK